MLESVAYCVSGLGLLLVAPACFCTLARSRARGADLAAAAAVAASARAATGIAEADSGDDELTPARRPATAGTHDDLTRLGFNAIAPRFLEQRRSYRKRLDGPVASAYARRTAHLVLDYVRVRLKYGTEKDARNAVAALEMLGGDFVGEFIEQLPPARRDLLRRCRAALDAVPKASTDRVSLADCGTPPLPTSAQEFSGRRTLAASPATVAALFHGKSAPAAADGPPHAGDVSQMHLDIDVPALPFRDYLKELIESVDDGTAERISETLANTVPQVDAFLRANFLAFANFFKLAASVQEEILAALSNREVAALVSGLDEKRRDLILRRVPRTRVALIIHQEHLLATVGAKRDAAHRHMRELVIKKMAMWRGVAQSSRRTPFSAQAS